MHTVVSHLHSVVAGTFMIYCDIGKMILNFIFEYKYRSYAGVDLTCLFLEDVLAKMPTIKEFMKRMLVVLSLRLIK